MALVFLVLKVILGGILIGIGIAWYRSFSGETRSIKPLESIPAVQWLDSQYRICPKCTKPSSEISYDRYDNYRDWPGPAFHVFHLVEVKKDTLVVKCSNCHFLFEIPKNEWVKIGK